jgi:hypothetical protein
MQVDSEKKNKKKKKKKTVRGGCRVDKTPKFSPPSAGGTAGGTPAVKPKRKCARKLIFSARQGGGLRRSPRLIQRFKSG